jgi:hypothetical protein
MSLVLPTLTLTDAQGAIVLNAFGGSPAVAAPAYTAWLTRSLIDYVIEAKRVELIAQSTVTNQTTLDTFIASLPPKPAIL